MTGGKLAFVADSPESLGLLVGGDQQTQRVGSVPPAEPCAGDNPRILVEETSYGSVTRLPMRREPGRQQARAIGQRHLFQRFLRRVGDEDGRRRGGCGRLRPSRRRDPACGAVRQRRPCKEEDTAENRKAWQTSGYPQSHSPRIGNARGDLEASTG